MTGWQMAAGGDGLSPIPILHLEVAAPAPKSGSRRCKPTASMIVSVNDDKLRVPLLPLQDDSFTAIVGSRRETVRIHQQGPDHLRPRPPRHPYADGGTLPHLYQRRRGNQRRTAGADDGHDPEGQCRGRRRIKAGDVAAVLESMKMELRISSEIDGVVTAVHCRAGETVERNAVMVVVDADG